MNRELIARARAKFKSLDGVVVVSPHLLAELADALEAADARLGALSVLANPTRTWAQTLQRDFEGKPLPVLVNADDVNRIVGEGDWQLPPSDESKVGDDV